MRIVKAKAMDYGEWSYNPNILRISCLFKLGAKQEHPHQTPFARIIRSRT